MSDLILEKVPALHAMPRSDVSGRMSMAVRSVVSRLGPAGPVGCEDALLEACPRIRTGMVGHVLERIEISGSRLDEMYRAHAPAARRLAYLLTGDRWTADDIVQDAFVRIAGRFLDLRDPTSAQGYVRRTVVSLVIARHRRSKVEARYAQRQRMERHAPHTDPDPADRDEMFAALTKVSERQRAALVLRYYLDLSDADIADALRCRPGTVKSLLSRGVDALREVMTDE